MSTKKLFISSALCLFLASLPIPASATISGGSITGNATTDLVAGTANADYNVSFVTDTSANASTITVTFPTGYSVTNGNIDATSIQSAGGTPSNISVNGGNVAISSITGNSTNRTLDIAITGTDLSVGTGVSFRILSGVTNTSTSGTTLTFSISTDAAGETAQSNIAGVLITPAAISTLVCEASSQGGAVWLRWTTPVGTSNGYEVKYEQGNSITYATATTYTQSWESGTVGGAQQQLITGLNPSTQYTFAMKAKGGNASLSAISTLTPTCYAPIGNNAKADSTAPTTNIVSPAKGATVSNITPVIIKGNSLDKGGSSVQKVEISLDGGSNWVEVKVISNEEGNLVWEYLWVSPSVGDHKVLIRATDWVNNVETPVELPLTISNEAPKATPETPKVVETPKTPATPTDKATLIASLETQLKTLLQELIALLTKEISSKMGR